MTVELSLGGVGGHVTVGQSLGVGVGGNVTVGQSLGVEVGGHATLGQGVAGGQVVGGIDDG